MSCRTRLLQNLLPRRHGIPSSPYCAKGRSFALLVKQPLSRADIATIARGTACKLLRVAEQPYRRQYVRTCAADENHDQVGALSLGIWISSQPAALRTTKPFFKKAYSRLLYRTSPAIGCTPLRYYKHHDVHQRPPGPARYQNVREGDISRSGSGFATSSVTVLFGPSALLDVRPGYGNIFCVG